MDWRSRWTPLQTVTNSTSTARHGTMKSCCHGSARRMSEPRGHVSWLLGCTGHELASRINPPPGLRIV